METLNITVYVLPQKRRELLRAFRSILDQVRQDSDCISSSVKQTGTNADIIVLEQTWSRWDAVKRYLQSDQFTILLGAMKLLGKFYDIRINESSQTDGLKLVETVRKE